MLRVVTITIICSKLSIYDPVEHLRCSFYCENSKPLSIFQKKKKTPSWMLAWVLNTPLLFEDSLNILFLKSILHYKTLEICNFFIVLYFF